jgi:ABC-type anion transport system duplicated permease subunit
MLSPPMRRALLTAHVACSVGTMGAVAAFLALAITGVVSADASLVAAVYPAMRLITWVVIVPLVLASLLSGVMQALGTQWGLLRHYWVLIKLVLNVLVVGVLALQLNGIDYLADAAAHGRLEGVAHGSVRLSLVVHAAGGFVVLLTATILSVYKPRGLTRHGQRMRNTERHR